MRVPFLDLAPADAGLEEELERAASRVIRSGRYILGPEVERFEAEFARYCGVAAGVGVGNGLEALQLTLQAFGIGPGDEVIVSAHTSIATWLAISHTGAIPVPVEPDPRTMMIDPALVADAVSPRSAAIVPVHLYGMPAAMDALAAIARKHRLALIEDASQAHGARLRDRMVGSLGDAAAFSLYPTKNLGALGDGGIVVSDDLGLIERVRVLANYGERQRHRSELRGHNSRLDELQAALLSVKLRRLDAGNVRRSALAGRYLDLLSECAGVQLPAATAASQPAWHQFVVRVQDRDGIRAALTRDGIETLVHYPIAPHRSPAYARDYPEPLAITEQLAASVLSLPIHPDLTDDQCAHVCQALAEIAAAA